MNLFKFCKKVGLGTINSQGGMLSSMTLAICIYILYCNESSFELLFHKTVTFIICYCSMVMYLLKKLDSNLFVAEKEDKHEAEFSDEELWDSFQDIRDFGETNAAGDFENIPRYNQENFFEQNPGDYLDIVSKESLINEIFKLRELVDDLKKRLKVKCEYGDGERGMKNFSVKPKTKADLEVWDLEEETESSENELENDTEYNITSDDEYDSSSEARSTFSLCDSLDLYRNLRSQRVKDGEDVDANWIYKIKPDLDSSEEDEWRI